MHARLREITSRCMMSALEVPSPPCDTLLLHERARYDLRARSKSDELTHKHNILLSILPQNRLHPVNLIDVISVRSSGDLLLTFKKPSFTKTGDLASDCAVPVKDGTEYVE